MSGGKERPHIREALLRLRGKPAWGLVRDHGSMFFLEMGTELLDEGMVRAHGEWHFLIECCHWRFETADKILGGSEDEQPFIDGMFEKLDLGSVENAEVLAPSHDLLVKFSSGMRCDKRWQKPSSFARLDSRGGLSPHEHLSN
jgi:hypothetical protein